MQNLKKVIKWIGTLLLILVLIFILAWTALQFPAVQTKVVQRVTKELSKTLNTKVSIGKVDIDFFKTVALKDIYIEDQRHDTLLFAKELDATIGVLSLFDSKIQLSQVTLQNATINLSRPQEDSLFNFNFLLDAFSSSEPKVKKDTTSTAWEFGIGNVLLQSVRFKMEDEFGGINLTANLGGFSTNLAVMDLVDQRLEFDQISLKKSIVRITQSNSNKIQTPDNQKVTNEIDSIAFPFTGWNLLANNLTIADSDIFFKQKNASEIPRVLNPNDIALENIQLEIQDFIWEKDKLNALLKNIAIQEKSGFQIKEFGLNLAMSPQQIILENLTITTPNSYLKNTTNLQFNDFSDLANNIDNITFTIDFAKTKIGSEDLEHLVSTIGEIPFLDLSINRSVQLNGKIAGNLNQFLAESLEAQIENALLLKVNGTVQNIRDIERLKFNLNLQKLSTSYDKANSILKNVTLPEGLKSFGVFNINGKIEGMLNDLKLANLVLTTDANTGFDVTGTVKGLPKLENLNMDLAIENIYTLADDLDGFSPNGMPDILDSLGKVNYQGKFKGTLTEFDLAGKLETKLGVLESDIFMNFSPNYSTANYKGDIQLNAFQLGKLLGDSLKVGEVTLNAELIGDGFKVDSMKADLKVNIEKLEYSNYTYSNILVDGLLQQGIFIGKLDLKDPNATVDFDGKVSLNLEEPVYQFTMEVDTLNLFQLNLIEEDLSLHAKMDMNFSGKKLNDFDGKINLTDIFIKNNGKVFTTDTLEIIADNAIFNNRKFSVNSSFLTGKVTGDYDFDEMYDLILAYINDYFPLDDLLSRNQKMVEFADIQNPQKFELLFDLKDAEPISIFLPELEYMENARLTATFNSVEKTMKLGVGIQNIRMNGVGAETIFLNSTGNAKQLTNTLTINQLEATNGVRIPQTILTNQMLNDSMYFHLNVENDTIDQLIEIAAVMTNSTEGYRLEFEKEMVANNKEWTIDQQNFVNFSSDFLKINELIFYYENQSIGIHSLQGKSSEPVPPIEISFDNFQIKSLSNIANIQNTSFEGQLNGNFKVIDPFDNLHYTANMTIPNMSLNDENIGALSINLDNPVNTQLINVNVLLEGEQNNMDITGDYNFGTQKYDVKANLQSIELRLIDPIMIGVFGQSKGIINGNFTLQGTPEKPQLNGGINLNQISTVIDFTKTRYAINEGKVTFNNKEINLGTLQLTDRKNDQATLNGKITHNFFSDMNLDLKINTSRFTFLNTESKDNSLFYGKLFLSANAVIKGPVEQPVIDVKAKTLTGSELNVSAFSEEDSFQEESFIIFGNPATYKKDQEKEGEVVYEVQSALPAEVRLNLELTDQAIFRVIVDPITGDQLECIGNSDMIINLLPSGAVDIFGSYIIESGKYRFSYTDLVKRNFDIVKGSSVEFNGDPLNARFNVTAKYSTKATPYELVSNETTLSPSETSFAQKQQKVDVLMKMSGNIGNPELNFDLDLPESEGSIVNSEIQRKLAELRTNSSELNKQVFGLILFNGFIASSASAGFEGAGESVVLGSVSKFFSKQLNQLADKYIKGVQVNVDLNSYKSQYINEGEGGTVTELGIGVTKEFNDRLSLKAGGNFDLGSTAQSSGFSQVAGDFVLEYKLTKSGNYILKVFRRSDFDVLNEENSVKTGAGISVSKSFGGKKKKK